MSERTEKMKQKQWVQIAAVFFGLMIVLTICSRAASSAVKARVTVTRASRQKISHEISLNGSVEAKNYVLQYVTSGLMVTGVQVSPGQQVEAGDVIFTVDMQKLQESIASIETELNRVDEKERLSVSRAEAAYQDVKANAEEEKARAYQTYEKAVAEYQNYINTHKKTAGVSAESTEERTMNEKAASVYDETVAKELENAVESEKSAYAAVVREQEKQISAAADASTADEGGSESVPGYGHAGGTVKKPACLCGKRWCISGRIHRCSWTAECDRRYGDCGGHRGHAG